MSKQNQACCQYCSKPDDSSKKCYLILIYDLIFVRCKFLVQVVCESRCLLCSRCQLVPGIRRLLVDNTVFSDDPSLDRNASGDFSLTEDSPKRSNLPSTAGLNGAQVTALRGSCPLCASPIAVSMLAMIQTYREAFRIQAEEQAAVSLIKSLVSYFS